MAKAYLQYFIPGYSPKKVYSPGETLSVVLFIENTHDKKEIKVKNITVEARERWLHYGYASAHHRMGSYGWIDTFKTRKKYPTLSLKESLKPHQKAQIKFSIQLPTKWNPRASKKDQGWHLELAFNYAGGLLDLPSTSTFVVQVADFRVNPIEIMTLFNFTAGNIGMLAEDQIPFQLQDAQTEMEGSSEELPFNDATEAVELDEIPKKTEVEVALSKEDQKNINQLEKQYGEHLIRIKVKELGLAIQLIHKSLSDPAMWGGAAQITGSKLEETKAIFNIRIPTGEIKPFVLSFVMNADACDIFWDLEWGGMGAKFAKKGFAINYLDQIKKIIKLIVGDVEHNPAISEKYLPKSPEQVPSQISRPCPCCKIDVVNPKHVKTIDIFKIIDHLFANARAMGQENLRISIGRTKVEDYDPETQSNVNLIHKYLKLDGTDGKANIDNFYDLAEFLGWDDMKITGATYLLGQSQLYQNLRQIINTVNPTPQDEIDITDLFAVIRDSGWDFYNYLLNQQSQNFYGTDSRMFDRNHPKLKQDVFVQNDPTKGYSFQEYFSYNDRQKELLNIHSWADFLEMLGDNVRVQILLASLHELYKDNQLWFNRWWTTHQKLNEIISAPELSTEELQAIKDAMKRRDQLSRPSDIPPIMAPPDLAETEIPPPPKEKNCMHCGKTLPINAKFCNNCGKPN